MFGERLKLARKRAGLSLQALAERMSPKVTAQAISKYEHGQMMPSSSVLVGLARVLDVSLDFLMSSQVSRLSDVAFRKHSGSSALDRTQVEAMVIERLEDDLAIEEILEIKPPDDPFAGVRCDSIHSLADAELKANELRQAWELGNDPIPSLTDLLESKGIKVVEADLPPRVDGLACLAERSDGRPSIDAVVVSARSNVERKRFNLAHELAHRVILGTANPELPLERAMHRFAAAFLAPANHLRGEIGEARRGVSYAEIIRLKKLYGMSASAMLMRLRDVGLLPAEAIERAFRGFARGWRTDEPAPIQDQEGLGAFERPQRFARLVDQALVEQKISPARAAQLLKLPLSAIEERVRGPSGL